MLSLNGRKFSNIRIHQTSLVDGFGNIGPVITKDSKKLGSVELTATDLGVLFKSGNTEALIPWANVVSAQLIKE